MQVDCQIAWCHNSLNSFPADLLLPGRAQRLRMQKRNGKPRLQRLKKSKLRRRKKYEKKEDKKENKKKEDKKEDEKEDKDNNRKAKDDDQITQLFWR